MLAILALIFTLWCAYQWGKSASERDREFQNLREKMDEYARRENRRP